jgi:predicted Zn-ribbon and HTH transcriptional regulator
VAIKDCQVDYYKFKLCKELTELNIKPLATKLTRCSTCGYKFRRRIEPNVCKGCEEVGHGE